MSLLLDDKLVSEVAEVCPAEFLDYYKCLSKGDAQQCYPQQKTLSTCVLAKSPSFKKITSGCSKQMKAYEDCIRKDPDYRTQCFDLLVEMRDCVSQVIEK